MFAYTDLSLHMHAFLASVSSLHMRAYVCIYERGAPNVTKFIPVPTYISPRMKSAYADLCLHIQPQVCICRHIRKYADISPHMQTSYADLCMSEQE